jgi:hypothetical protein
LAIGKGYEIHSVISFWREIQSARPGVGRPRLVLRHDIDSDVSTAKAIAAIERDLGVRSSFYFRLSTVDVPFMRSIEASGSEASYHYEEIATVAKHSFGIRHPSQIAEVLPAARQMFANNLTRLRQLTGLPMLTVAAHGDFVNRALGVQNQLLLQDYQLRQHLNILVEAYDEELMRPVTARYSDHPYPEFWMPTSPLKALEEGADAVYILTHPKRWRASWTANIGLLGSRVWEGLRYSAGNLLSRKA